MGWVAKPCAELKAPPGSQDSSAEGQTQLASYLGSIWAWAAPAWPHPLLSLMSSDSYHGRRLRAGAEAQAGGGSWSPGWGQRWHAQLWHSCREGLPASLCPCVICMVAGGSQPDRLRRTGLCRKVAATKLSVQLCLAAPPLVQGGGGDPGLPAAGFRAEDPSPLAFTPAGEVGLFSHMGKLRHEATWPVTPLLIRLCLQWRCSRPLPGVPCPSCGWAPCSHPRPHLRPPALPRVLSPPALALGSA